MISLCVHKNTTPISRIEVRPSHYRTEGFKGEALNWVPIMPRDASLLDSQCRVFFPNLEAAYRKILVPKTRFSK